MRDRPTTADAGAPRPAGRGALAAALGLAGLTAYLVASALSFWPYTVDDAFITQRYARHLAEGLGPVYNPGERVEGYSNPLWTLVAAFLHVSGLPRILGVKWLGLVCAALTVPLTYLLGRRVGLERTPALLAAALVATSASVALWAVAGLETTSFALLLVAAVLRFEREREEPDARPWSALLWVLVWLSRPEAPAYLLYPLVRRALDLGARPARRRDIVWLAAFGAPVLAFELFGLAYYGALLPATHGAKLGDGPELVRGGLGRWLLWRYATEQGAGFVASCVVLGTGAGVALARRRVAPAVWAPAAAGLAFILYAFTDWMPRYRFVVPVLPFLAVAGMLGLQDVAGWRPGRGWRRAVLALVLAAVSWGAVDQATRGLAGRNAVHLAVAERGAWWAGLAARAREPWHPGRQEEDAWFVTLEVPRGEWVAAFDIGLIGELSDHLLWDARGLVTPAAARGLNAANDSTERRALWDDLWARRPAVIIVPRRPGSLPRVPRVYLEGLRTDARFAAAYEELPDLLPFRVVLRRRDLRPPDDQPGAVLAAFGRLPGYRTEAARRWRRWLYR